VIPVLNRVGYSGLTSAEASFRRQIYGENVLPSKRQYSLTRLFFSQFTSPLINILLAATIITLLLRDYLDAVVIAAAVFINTLLGFYQEYKAQKSLAALAKVLSPQARVIRDHKDYQLEAHLLVPGDLIIVHEGEKIPADAIVLYHHDLLVNEALLTGESRLVAKQSVAAKLSDPKNDINSWAQKLFLPLEKRPQAATASVYMGTIVESGLAHLFIVHTGGRTQLGQIAASLTTTTEPPTPLQIRLKSLSHLLAAVVAVAASSIFVFGLFLGNSFTEIFTLSVAIAVAAIPEGLAVSLTIILALGMQRILKRQALVRKLVAAEVLGSVSTICVDKTGTITEGRLRVIAAETIDKDRLLIAAIVGNSRKDPVEVSLWQWAVDELDHHGKQKLNTVEAIQRRYPILDQLPFRSERRFGAVLTKPWLFVTGAPEVILSYCHLDQKEKKDWQAKISHYARQGLRLVSLAYRPRQKETNLSVKTVTSHLIWLGLVAYEDPLRSNMHQVLEMTYHAGIDVKVITGDYRETAKAVMTQLGWKLEESHILEGPELARLTPAELVRRVKNIGLFVRTTPAQKLAIVEALQNRGEVVAMTGDGVNDAPALKKADIGIVVSTASDVSKETADMVLLDNNFSTILAAVEEGRGIFENLKKIILYLLSDSFTEVIVIVVAGLIGLPLPITAAQILWVNLIDDGFPNIALTLNPKDKNLLHQAPHPRTLPLVDTQIKVLVTVISCLTAAVVLSLFSWYYRHFDLNYARTVAFAVLGVDSLLYVFSALNLHYPIWRQRVKNPWLVAAVIIGFLLQLAAIYLPPLQRLFSTYPLTLSDWLVILLSGFGIVIAIEFTKWLFLLNSRRQFSSTAAKVVLG